MSPLNLAPITLADLKARYGTPPADLVIEMRGNKVLLSLGDRIVEMGVPVGPIAWDDVLMRYVLPALAALQNDAMAREIQQRRDARLQQP